MAIKAKFVGDSLHQNGPSNNPDFIKFGGVTFPLHKDVELPVTREWLPEDAKGEKPAGAFLIKLRGNHHFVVEEKK